MLKELKICFKMQSKSVLLDMTKVDNFRWKSADASRTKRMFDVYLFFGCFLGKV